jgi:hypothetical protein
MIDLDGIKARHAKVCFSWSSSNDEPSVHDDMASLLAELARREEIQNAYALVKNTEISKIDAELDELRELLGESRADYANAIHDAQTVSAIGCNVIELGVKLSTLLGKIARIDAALGKP